MKKKSPKSSISEGYYCLRKKSKKGDFFNTSKWSVKYGGWCKYRFYKEKMPKKHKFPRLQALECQKYVTPQTELYLKMLSQNCQQWYGKHLKASEFHFNNEKKSPKSSISEGYCLRKKSKKGDFFNTSKWSVKYGGWCKYRFYIEKMPKNHKFPRLQALESQKYVTPQTELYLKMLSQNCQQWHGNHLKASEFHFNNEKKIPKIVNFRRLLS